MNKLSLTNKSAEFLRDILQSHGWAKTTDAVYIGGKILVTHFENFKSDPESKLVINLDLSDKEFAMCQTAIKHIVSMGSLPVSKDGITLLETFKLVSV